MFWLSDFFFQFIRGSRRRHFLVPTTYQRMEMALDDFIEFLLIDTAKLELHLV